MFDATLLKIVFGAFCVMITSISVAFVVYWNIFGKKHGVVQKQDTEEIDYAATPALSLGVASNM
jgi:hypothetical protein